MNTDYTLLAEKEGMWAEMLMQVLRDNGIPCTAIPVYGAGLVMKTGKQERLKVYVPRADREKAEELLGELFPQGEE